jgi:hypothetical protein
MKNDILAFLIGLFSGFVVVYAAEHFPSVVSVNGETFFGGFTPGIIFGIFVAPFLWLYSRSIWRVLVFVVGSSISFVAAFWAGFFSELILFRDIWTLGLVGGYTVGGIVGVLVLIAVYRMLFGKMSAQWILAIIAFGAIVPMLSVLFFGVYYGEAGETLKAIGQLVVMSLWQGFMLFAFAHLLRKQQGGIKGVIFDNAITSTEKQ